MSIHVVFGGAATRQSANPYSWIRSLQFGNLPRGASALLLYIFTVSILRILTSHNSLHGMRNPMASSPSNHRSSALRSKEAPTTSSVHASTSQPAPRAPLRCLLTASPAPRTYLPPGVSHQAWRPRAWACCASTSRDWGHRRGSSPIRTSRPMLRTLFEPPATCGITIPLRPS